MKVILSATLFTLSLAISSYANEGAFDETKPLTDEEAAASETYIHQGKVQETYNKMCYDENNVLKEECNQSNESAFKSDSTAAKVEAMMPAVTKVYTMITGLGGQMQYIQKENGSPILKNKEGTISKDESGAYVDKGGNTVSQSDIDKGDYKQQTKDGQDYCAMIPMVTETAATFYQQTKNQQTEQNLTQTEGTQVQQAASFYAMAKVHKDRSKSAKMQMAGWGSTAACYAAMMATSTITANFGSVAKTGGAVLLTSFYGLKSKAHLERAALLEKMAEELPSAGDCNPHTETTCFCNEDSSIATDLLNYQKYCVPQNFHAETADSFVCMTEGMTPDPACDCKNTGTCINAKFASIGAKIGLDPSVMNNPLSGITPLSSGFGTAGVDAITDKNLAFAKKTINENAPTDIPNISLTDKQKSLAKDMAKMGVPKLAVVPIVSAKSSGGLPASLSGGALGSGSASRNSSLNKAMAAVKKASFSSGSSAKTSRSKSSNSFNPYSKYGKKNSNRGAKGVDIINFAQKAQREATINKDTSKPIFDIITNRYKTTAWREFKDNIQESSKK